MNLLTRIAVASRRELIRVACVLSLVGLFILVYSVVLPGPLPIIFAMSVGHVIGGVAFGCYVLAIVLDVARRGRESLRPSDPGPRHSVRPPE